ncbi:hypothetical protein QOT17_005140 [Balamuthia mandrillaris]
MGDSVQIVKDYLQARMANDVPALLKYIADDIVFVNEKEGKQSGKDNFEKFVKANGPKGKWDEPQAEGDAIIVKGHISMGFIKVKLQSTFKVNSEGKINYSELKRL